MVRWAWGSRSIRQTLLPSSARAAPRLTVVVVLPTPPFWFIRAMIRMVLAASVGAGRGSARPSGQSDKDRVLQVLIGLSWGSSAVQAGPPATAGRESTPDYQVRINSNHKT